MKIASAWSGHDCSFCVLDDGVPIVHAELERYIREKEPAGDGVQFLFDTYGDDFKHFVVVTPASKTLAHEESFQTLIDHVKKRDGMLYEVGHHQSHASNAFFSSNFDEATIITIDGGGIDDQNIETALTIWHGKGNKIIPLQIVPMGMFNVGGLWTRVTRYVFELQSGWPYGHQAGTVMAMAAMGDPDKYVDDFLKMLTTDIRQASFKPPSQPRGALVPGKDPVHPYLDKWKQIAIKSEQDGFDVAAGLQAATEIVLNDVVKQSITATGCNDICFAGGVSLNSVAMGKLLQAPMVNDIFVTPVPHDGGLTIGAAQYLWHHVMDNPRIKWQDNASPYLGEKYELDLDDVRDIPGIKYNSASVDNVIDMLVDGKIVAVFSGGSESGRRALGNRSILADPRNPDMKDLINQKVKHRQWFRPFAPSIMREYVSEWFTYDTDSPYMEFVLNFKDEKKELVPAVVHLNGSARLQTVTKNDNEWYYELLEKFYTKTGVPIILNTSFNDREPVVDSPAHAINCFCATDIDALFFVDEGIILSKQEESTK